MKRLTTVLIVSVFVTGLGTAHAEGIRVPGPRVTPATPAGPPKPPTTPGSPQQPNTPTAGPNTPGGPKTPTPGGPKVPPPKVTPQGPPKSPNQPLPPGTRPCVTTGTQQWSSPAKCATITSKEECGKSYNYDSVWCVCDCPTNCTNPGRKNMHNITSDHPCQWASTNLSGGACYKTPLPGGTNPSFATQCNAACRAACGAEKK